MTDDRRRFPWANAHRIADEHDAEVSQLETAGYADMAAAFPNGIVFLDGMMAQPPAADVIHLKPALKAEIAKRGGGPIMIFEGPLSDAQRLQVEQMLADGKSPIEIMQTIEPCAPEPPRRWRWWRDPLVIGAAIGVVILVAVFLAVTP